jgi:hypothetical protein
MSPTIADVAPTKRYVAGLLQHHRSSEHIYTLLRCLLVYSIQVKNSWPNHSMNSGVARAQLQHFFVQALVLHQGNRVYYIALQRSCSGVKLYGTMQGVQVIVMIISQKHPADHHQKFFSLERAN